METQLTLDAFPYRDCGTEAESSGSLALVVPWHGSFLLLCYPFPPYPPSPLRWQLRQYCHTTRTYIRNRIRGLLRSLLSAASHF
ncbi:hypothetical protein MTO96_014229 [Rhipicephalus appendiculatus]